MRRSFTAAFLTLIAVLAVCSVVQAQGPMQPLPVASPSPVVIQKAESEGPERREGFDDPIETDRDSFTPATTTAGRRRLIVESSYSFLDNRGFFETHSFPELLLRSGVAERFELRLGWNYEVGGGGNAVSGVEGDEGLEGGGLERESRLLYGFKALLTEQERFRPASSLVLQAATPTSGLASATQVTATYVYGWELAQRWQLDSAIRYGTASEEGDRFGVWAPSAVLKGGLGERWNVHAEYFGLFSDGRKRASVRHFISPGVHYLVTPNLEIGIRLGWGLNDQSARFFSNVGVGYRF